MRYRHELENAKNEREDYLFLKQHLLLTAGMLPSQLEQEDYFDFLELMQAKPADQRTMSASTAHKRLRGR